jgi:hypothetical protein
MKKTLLFGCVDFSGLCVTAGLPGIQVPLASTAIALAHFAAFSHDGGDGFYAKTTLTTDDRFYDPTFTAPGFRHQDLVKWKQVHIPNRSSKLINQKVSEKIFPSAIGCNPQNKIHWSSRQSHSVSKELTLARTQHQINNDKEIV